MVHALERVSNPHSFALDKANSDSLLMARYIVTLLASTRDPFLANALNNWRPLSIILGLPIVRSPSSVTASNSFISRYDG